LVGPSSFHHLQMVASLRTRSGGTGRRSARRFHHLQMVASLRTGKSAGTHRSALSRFPPSPDGGFIEDAARDARCRNSAWFPPSPDGGFIEDSSTGMPGT